LLDFIVNPSSHITAATVFIATFSPQGRAKKSGGAHSPDVLNDHVFFHYRIVNSAIETSI